MESRPVAYTLLSLELWNSKRPYDHIPRNSRENKIKPAIKILQKLNFINKHNATLRLSSYQVSMESLPSR